MRKYVFAQMLLDIMTAMKRPTSELKATARAWLAHGSTLPDMMTDGCSYNEMVSPDELQELHNLLVDRPVGKIRGKAAEVAAWIAEEEDFETWKELPEASPEADDVGSTGSYSGRTSSFHGSTGDQTVQDMNVL